MNYNGVGPWNDAVLSLNTEFKHHESVEIVCP